MNNLRSIRSIDGFPGFADIEWTGPKAARFNLIYGWNRSGKTTVGRVLRMLEPDSEIPEGFEDIAFSLETDSGTVRESDRESDRLQTRVFNEDFIEEHVSFADASAQPIVIVGKASVDLEREISELNEKLTQLESEADTLEGELKKVPDLPKILSDCASNVLEELEDSGLSRYRGRTYKRPKVEALISSERITSENLSERVIDDPTRRDALRDLIVGRHKAVSANLPDLSDFETSFSTANSLLTRSIEVAVIERLQDDEELRGWIGTGYEIHTERDLSHCEFCGNKINQKRLARYGAYFTDEAATAEAELTDSIDALDTTLQSLDPDFPDSSKLVADLTETYTTQQKRAKKALKAIIETCNRLLSRLRKRKGQMHVRDTRQDEVPVPEEELTAAREALSEITRICEDHSSRVAEADRERPNAAKQLEEHVVAQILKNTDYFRHLAKEQRLRKKEEELNQKIDAKERALVDKRSALRKTGLALGKINGLIEEFLGPQEIELVGVENDDDDDEELPGYRVLNRGAETPYLSEGEKSVVALAYFLVKLEEEGIDPSETVIVLDDPVDSQDGIFLFRTVGLLRSMLNKAGQVIILTHNFQFFNLVRDWLNGPRWHEKSELFLIKMRRDDAAREVAVSPLPALLRDHKTEYQYLVGRLFDFKDNPTTLPAPVIPNIARKVLEYFSSFKWSCPKSEPFTSIVQNRFVRDGNRRERGVGRTVVKFLHEHSHGEDFSQPVSASAMEAESICSNVLEFIDLADKDHYRSLRKAFQKSSE